MQTHSYYSAATSKKSDDTKIWAGDNYNFFSGLISRYQFALGSCRAGNPKSVIAAALKQREQLSRTLPSDCSRAEYRKHFAGWTKVSIPEPAMCSILHERHFRESIVHGSKLFYVSAWNRIGLPYGDIDCHHAWQTPEMAFQGQLIFTEFFPSLGLASDRGANNWLKLDRGSYSCGKANLILLGDKEQGILGLEGAMQRVFAAANCWADFELKGTFAYRENEQWQWGKYGKLPIHRPEWDRQKLQKLTDQPVIHIRDIENFIQQVEREIPQSVLDEMNLEKVRRNADEPLLVDDQLIARIKANWGNQWREAMYHAAENQDEDGNWWLERKYLKPPQSSVSTTVVQPIQPAAASTRKPADVRVNQVDLQDEQDSFKRQRLALMRFARALGRVPRLQEALEHIFDQELYTGAWEGNSDRTKRVKAILRWLARTFDSSKIKKGSVHVGRHKQFVDRKFPNGIEWCRERRWLDDDCKTRSGFEVTQAPACFVSIFLDIVDYCLNEQPNENERFPTERCKRLWNRLFDSGGTSVRWCGRKFAACREFMNSCDVIRITDRNFRPGKAMTWKIGRFFPGRESWKRVKRQKPMTWSQFVAGLGLTIEKKKEEQEGYNTLLQSNPVQIVIPDHWEASRGPP